MKFGSLLILFAAAPAAAQPGNTPANPTPPPAPAPPPDGSTPTPDWLPGVTEVTGVVATNGQVLLTLDKAVEIAIKVQPTLREARAAVAVDKGRIDQAKVVEHPTVTLSGSLGTGSTRGLGSMNPNAISSSGGFFTPGFTNGLSATAAWRIYDFGQTAANVHAAELNTDAAVATVGTTVLDVHEQVELAYLEAVARARLVKVAQATVASEEGHLDQAKRFVAAGAQDPIEVAQAQSRFANAKSALAQAQSNEAIALANLRAAIGMVELQQSLVVDPNWPDSPDKQPSPLGELVNVARQHRPEIIQLDKQIAASDASLTAAHAERRPILSASASVAEAYDFDGNSWVSQPTWAAGATLAWQLWDGGKSAADVKVAEANLVNSEAQRDGILVTVTSQLDSARSQIVANKANVAASTEAVTAAQTQLKLADARYSQGLGSQIELADAQTAVTTAEGNLVTAEWQLADAWAQLRRALGQG